LGPGAGTVSAAVGSSVNLSISVKRSHHVRRERLEIPTLIRIYTVGFYEDLKV
jgi:hypothetical protein